MIEKVIELKYADSLAQKIQINAKNLYLVIISIQTDKIGLITNKTTKEDTAVGQGAMIEAKAGIKYKTKELIAKI